MTSAYRFLPAPRRLGGTALAPAAATVCLRLGVWQLGRFHEKAAATRRESTTRPPEPCRRKFF
ncbi:hypothetical protein ACF9IK_04315 [Kitasatospora hibisci]|uniref:hypothetical protein n=1 Tax=Kitasatospora hibisci TaxID=3369522 RepID=UPI00375489EF